MRIAHIVLMALAFGVAGCGESDTGSDGQPGAGRGSGKPSRRTLPEDPPKVEKKWVLNQQGDVLEFCIWKMDCSGCESSVKTAIRDLEGVDHVEADRFSCIVTVRLEEGAKLDALTPQIEKALSEGGAHKEFDVIGP